MGKKLLIETHRIHLLNLINLHKCYINSRSRDINIKRVVRGETELRRQGERNTRLRADIYDKSAGSV